MKKLIPVIFALLLCSCSSIKVEESQNEFEAGFASEIIKIPEDGPLYIAGYHQQHEIEGFLDYQKVSAVSLNDTILISIDSIGISNKIVKKIRAGLKNISNNVNVFSTHDHAGIDTLGLWGGVALNGKNEVFIDNLVEASIKAAKDSYDNKRKGKMYFGYENTGDLQEDSRNPIVFDSNIYQFRFENDLKTNGIRIINYAAHAESLRGNNFKVSADYVGRLRNQIKQRTTDDVLFIQGAIGGLIMTKELTSPFNAEENMVKTASELTECVLNISNEVLLNSKFAQYTSNFKTRLDNTVYMFYKFLGILDNELYKTKSMTGYGIKSEISIMTIDDILIYLVPGEIFPELVYGGFLSENDPDSLKNLAKEKGFTKILVFGLANDELGYIIPKSQYLLNETAPYLETIKDDTGENHYEETNSTSSNCCIDIYNAFSNLIAHINKN